MIIYLEQANGGGLVRFRAVTKCDGVTCYGMGNTPGRALELLADLLTDKKRKDDNVAWKDDVTIRIDMPKGMEIHPANVKATCFKPRTPTTPLCYKLRTRNGCTDMTPDPAGEWVRREDYEAKRASEAAALERVKVLTEAGNILAASASRFHSALWSDAITPTEGN